MNKRNTTGRFLRAIFIMQAIGFLTICTLKYNIDVYSSNYRNIEAKSYMAMIKLEGLIADIYQHENLISKYTTSGEIDDLEMGKAECAKLRERAENEMIECDVAFKEFKHFTGYDKFEDLKTSITAYFNCSDIMFVVRQERSYDIAYFLFNSKMNQYIESANLAMDEINELANKELDETKVKMHQTLILSRVSFIVGIVIFFIATMIFIWYCKRMLRDQELYMLEADSANRAKSAFLSNMSHEIRTPINAIIGMNEMIGRNSEDPKIIEYSDNIESSSKSLLSLVNDILDFSRIEAGKMQLYINKYDLREIIKEAWTMIFLKAEDKNLELKFDIDETMPFRLSGDSTRIRQVLVNLLTNAVKYTEKGSVTLSIKHSKLPDSTNEAIIAFAVKDTGIGLNPKELEKLTRPFERLDENRTKSIEGSGLGLSIVKNLLALMDSKLDVSSVYGEGSTFGFSVKQQVDDWEMIRKFSPNEKNKKTSHKKVGPLFTASTANILAVDDNELNRVVLTELLKRTLVHLDLATGGLEAVEKAKNKKYDLILMDHRMPDVDGIESYRMIKEDSLNKETPAIIVTANAVSPEDDIYSREGFVAYVLKPINSAALEKTILEFLNRDLIDADNSMNDYIDEEAGIKANGSKEMYLKVVDSYINSAESSINEISSLMNCGDIKNYTIKVHALKSASRLVGAIELSELAKFLEKCGDENDVETIYEKTDEMLRIYDSVVRKLNEKYNIIKTEALLEYDKEYMGEVLTAMSEASEAFDFDMVDKCYKEVIKYTIPESLTKDFNDLKAAIYAVDQAKIIELCKKINGV